MSVYRTIGPLVRGVRSYFSFLFHFLIKFMKANRMAPDGVPRFAVSHLGLFCWPMSHKKDNRLIWVNKCKNRSTGTCILHGCVNLIFLFIESIRNPGTIKEGLLQGVYG